MPDDNSTLELRPARGWRLAMWIFGVFGVLFGLSALAGDNIAGEVLMGLFGLMVLIGAINGAIYRVTCDASGLRIRAVRRKFVPVASVQSLTPRVVAGYGSPRVRIEVRLRDGGTVKLTTLQRYDTAKNRQRCEADAEAMRAALRLPSTP